MAAAGGKVIVVTGATGLQGGAVTRHLLMDGWQVRALSRNAASGRARALPLLPAELLEPLRAYCRNLGEEKPPNARSGARRFLLPCLRKRRWFFTFR